jgi:hypothetical protein
LRVVLVLFRFLLGFRFSVAMVDTSRWARGVMPRARPLLAT